jgi:hypothetical protein
MIDFIKKDDQFFLMLGYDFILKVPKRIIPVTRDEAIEIASSFNEELALAIGNKTAQWEYKNFKLTDAPRHPFGWTDTIRRRSILYYQQQGWHMLVSEIAVIGRLAKRALDSHD